MWEREREREGRNCADEGGEMGIKGVFGNFDGMN